MSERNFKEETLNFMDRNGLYIEEIEWIGSEDMIIPLENFWKISDFTYDAGYGAQHIPEDLVIVGEDWWMERSEYDGAEWWSLKRKPIKPTKSVELDTLPLGMWDTLINAIERMRDENE